LQRRVSGRRRKSLNQWSYYRLSETQGSYDLTGSNLCAGICHELNELISIRLGEDYIERHTFWANPWG
jgi:hypothetical protein